MTARILVILGHPQQESFCGAIATAYATGARETGSEVREILLGNLNFDPMRRGGYSTEQPLEQDLVSAQESILWAQHIVFVYPLWWGAMPALLKGFIDRVFVPDFAFRYRKGSKLWERLLKGRSAHLFVTMDSPPWYYRWICRMPGHKQMKQAILGFSGVKPVGITNFGSVRNSTLAQREKWLAQARTAGAKGS